MTTKTNEVKFTQGGWNRNIPPAAKYTTIFAGRNTHVCHLSTSGLSEEEIEANCNLIKSAPDLLNMLQRVMDEICMTEEGMKHVCSLTLEHARNALAKAEGKEA